MFDLKENEYVTIDNIDYLIIAKITGKNNYIFLSNENDINDFFIKKVITKDSEQMLVNLDNESEFDEAMELFEKNYK